MRSGADLPAVTAATPMREVIAEITRGRMGITCVVDADGRLDGRGHRRRRPPRHRRDARRPGADRRDDHEPRAGHGRPRHARGRGAPPLEQRKITAVVVVDAGRRAARGRAPARPVAHGTGVRSARARRLPPLHLGAARRCWPASPSARPGSATSCATAAGSTAARPAIRTTTSSGLNFLVANQIDLAIEELSQAARVDADALEIHLILGNVYRERGQVVARHPGAPVAAAAPEADPPGTRLRDAVPGPRLQARRLRRSRRRGVQGGAPSRPVEHLRPAAPREGLRGTAPVGRRRADPAGTGGDRRSRVAGPQPGDSRLPRERTRPDRAEGRRPADRAGPLPRRPRARRLRDAGVGQSRRRPRTRRADRAEAVRTWEGVVDRRPSAPTWCSIACARPTPPPGSPIGSSSCAAGVVATSPQNWRARLALGRALADRRAAGRGARPVARGAQPQPARAHRARSDLGSAARR